VNNRGKSLAVLAKEYGVSREAVTRGLKVVRL